MGLTQKLGTIPLAISTDASNNVGIGGSPSGSYKLEVTGTGYYSGVLRVGAATGFAVGSIAGYRRIEYTGTTFSMLTNADGYAGLNAGVALFSSDVQSSSYFRSNTSTTNSITIGVSANTNYGYIGNSNYWGIRTGTAGDFNIDVNNSASPINALNILQSGKIGIGTSSPSTLLHINTTARTSGTNVNMVTLSDTVTGVQTSGYGKRIVSTSNNGSSVSAIAFEEDGGTNNDTAIAFYTQSTANALTRRVTVNRSGQLRITQAANEHSSDGLSLFNTANNVWNIVNGGDNNFYFGYNSSSKAQINGTGTYTALSDINKKKDFEESTIGLSAILCLKPTLYRMKEDEHTSEKYLGFIAQEVKDFIPQAYSESMNGDEVFIGLTQMPIIATLVKAIQELNQQNQDLKSRLDKAGL